MFPSLTETGRKYNGDVSMSPKPSVQGYGKYLDDLRIREGDVNPLVKNSSVNATISDYKYIPKHQMSPHQQQPQKHLSGKRTNRQLENKPSLLAISKSSSLQKEHEYRREPHVSSLLTPRQKDTEFTREFVDKDKLSPADLRRINENRRLVQLDPIGSSDVEIRNRVS